MNIISNGMTKTCLAVLFGVVLTASGLWASAGAEEEPAAAAEKEMVMDPSTGEMVTAPEYGGTLTFANKLATVYIDSFYGGFAGSTQSGFTEKLGIATWEIDRNVFNLQSGYVPLSVIRGSLLQNSGAQERSRRRQVRTNRLVAFRRRIRRQDICGGSNRPESRAEAASLAVCRQICPVSPCRESADPAIGRVQFSRRINWSTVSARMPNIRWHSTLAGPRTRI